MRSTRQGLPIQRVTLWRRSGDPGAAKRGSRRSFSSHETRIFADPPQPTRRGFLPILLSPRDADFADRHHETRIFADRHQSTRRGFRGSSSTHETRISRISLITRRGFRGPARGCRDGCRLADRAGRIAPTLSGVISEAGNTPPRRSRAAAASIRHQHPAHPAVQPICSAAPRVAKPPPSPSAPAAEGSEFPRREAGGVRRPARGRAQRRARRARHRCCGQQLLKRSA
jgi:hypothetical protein